jgi:TolA-binding protein
MEQAGDVPADPGLAALTPPAPAPEAGAPAPAGAPLPADETPQPIDVESDPEVEKIDDKGESEETESGSEELDITELVDSQKNIETKQEEYFNNLFSQLSDLQSKLSEMDTIMTKLNSLENKIEKYREKTPQEKLELRSYDSYPFNQKLTDFFDDKKEEMEKTGKNDYVLTTDDVTDINDKDIKDSFQFNLDDEENM